MAAKKKAPAKKETKGSAIKAIVNAFKGKKAKVPAKKVAKVSLTPAQKKAAAAKIAKEKAAAKKAAQVAAAKEAAKKKQALLEAKAAAAKAKADAKAAAAKAKADAKLAAKEAKEQAKAAAAAEKAAAKPAEKKLTARQMAKAAAAAAAQAAIDAACREIACESASLIMGYCRLHYIKNWKKIKRKEIILREKKLNQYIEELVAKYPDKYIEAIRNDLSNEKDFAKVISDLDIDEGTDEFEGDTENVEAIVDSIRRDFEDDGDF